jgi:membrane-bound serine protease (ClpP class)
LQRSALLPIALLLFSISTQWARWFSGMYLNIGIVPVFSSSNLLISTKVASSANSTIIITILFILVIISVISYKVYEAMIQGPKTGAETLIGSRGVTVTKLDPEGEVRVHGEMWEAVAVDSQGLVIRVKKVSGNGFSSNRGEKR